MCERERERETDGGWRGERETDRHQLRMATRLLTEEMEGIPLSLIEVERLWEEQV
jgi:hypothetical protein